MTFFFPPYGLGCMLLHHKINIPASPGLPWPARASPGPPQAEAEPSRAEPARTEPGRAVPSQVEPARNGQSRAEPSHDEPRQADTSPDRAGAFWNFRVPYMFVFSLRLFRPFSRGLVTSINQTLPYIYIVHMQMAEKTKILPAP